MPSALIRSFEYDAARQILRIVFQTGRCYVYQEVPEAIFLGMKSAFSKGEYFNDHIRENFRFSRDSAAEREPER